MPSIEVPFEVEHHNAGLRLDHYLRLKIKRLSRTRIQRLIREKLRSDVGPLKPSSIVQAGLRFVLIKEVDDEKEPEASEPIRIVYDDGALLILDKPAGIAVHPSARYFKHTVTTWMGENALNPDGTRPNLGHRLDRETSGILACGRTPEAVKALKQAFRLRETEKVYIALCLGRIVGDDHRIDAPLRLIEETKIFMEVHPEGAESVTQMNVVKRGRLRDGTELSLVECRPKTGRQHQIRVHMRELGHPIVGDKMYSGERAVFLRYCDGEQTEADLAQLRLHRQGLHAASLTLPDPTTGEQATFAAPLAPDLQRWVDAEVTWDAA